MAKVTLRPQRLSDAKRFFEILTSKKFIYFPSKPGSVEEERKYLQNNAKWRKDHFAYNYAILLDGNVIGAGGIKINQHRKHIAEIGYFVDDGFWGKGIATKATRLLEKIAFTKLGINRLEIIMDKRNTASRRVAEKAGYKKEGIMKSVLLNKKKYYDGYLYAKTS